MEAVNGVSDGGDKGGPPPPSPLTGCYLLIVIGEPHCSEHKDIILQKVAKGLLSWNVNDCLVDVEKELAIITEQGLEGEEARYGERLIQFASENLVTEILIHPVVSTLAQCVRNLLSSFTRHRHIIHAGYTFANNGSWILQDGTFSAADFFEAFQEIEVLRVIRAYENGISLDLHCSPEGDWMKLPKESFTKGCKVRVNPNDVLTAGSPSITSFINYIEPFLIPAELEHILESSDVVGNIRFSRPTLYVFPGGQGDAALFGINGFNMLLDGGFSRKACFWDFVRHLDRLDAVLLTRLNNSNVNGISAILQRKKQNALYPQIGHFFCNIQERKAILSPDGDKDKDPLLVNLLEQGQEIVSNLRHLGLSPQVCYRDSEPINLYHKVGHGTLDMYVLSPAKDSREVREFLQKWNNNDQKIFANYKSKDFIFPLQNLVSICALLIWQPANADDTITRILFPGSSPQNKIFEGLDRIKSLEFIKHPVCSEKILASTSVIKSKVKESILERIAAPPEKKFPPIDNKKEKPKIVPEKAADNLNDLQIKNGEINGIQSEKIVKKSDSTESEKSLSKPKKVDSDKLKTKSKPETRTKLRSDSQQRKIKTAAEKKSSPTTPKKTVEKTNEELKEVKNKIKASPSATPAKSTKEANNRKVVESKVRVAPKKDVPKQSLSTATVEKKDAKPERKPISRRPKDTSTKLAASPSKKVNGIQKPDSIARRGKLDKEGTTDSSTVSTPSADQDTILKKDISKLTSDELQNLKAQELAELKEEQEAVKEIEAVFRKGELKDDKSSEFRKIKDLSIDDKLESEEYLIIEKTEIVQDIEQSKEDEIQKLTRDSEESEKPKPKLDSANVESEGIVEKKVVTEPEAVAQPTEEPSKEQVTEAAPKDISVTSPEEKVDSTDKKTTDNNNEDDIKEPAPESQPDEKGSTNIESGATTTAPTLPEDERIPLDEIKEDNGDQIEEKHVKEDTKEKEVPIIQLPPKTFETTVTKLPPVVGIRLDKQTHIRDIVKTPDEVADLPVHEEVDIDHFDGYGTDGVTRDTDETKMKKDKSDEENDDDKKDEPKDKGKELAETSTAKIDPEVIKEVESKDDKLEETAAKVIIEKPQQLAAPTKNDKIEETIQSIDVMKDKPKEIENKIAVGQESQPESTQVDEKQTHQDDGDSKFQDNIPLNAKETSHSPEEEKEKDEQEKKDDESEEKLDITMKKSDVIDKIETIKSSNDTPIVGESTPDHKKTLEDIKETVSQIEKIDEKLQKLKEGTKIDETHEVVKIDFKVEEQPSHAEPVVIASDSPNIENKPYISIEEKMELGRKSPKEREEDVAKLVASVAEVLKSDAPLEEFEGKVPIVIPYKGYTTELRETHITTVESPITEDKKLIKDMISEEPENVKTATSIFLTQERTIEPIVEETLKEVKAVTVEAKPLEDLKAPIPEVAEEDVDSGTVHRMLVTTSSEDGGEEIEICPAGTITFSRSSESSGRSSPDILSQKLSQKSSVADTLSDPTTVAKSIRELQSGKDSGIDEDTKDNESEATKTFVETADKPIVKDIQEKQVTSKASKENQKELPKASEVAVPPAEEKKDISDLISEKVETVKGIFKDIFVDTLEKTDSKVKEEQNSWEKKTDEVKKEIDETKQTSTNFIKDKIAMTESLSKDATEKLVETLQTSSEAIESRVNDIDAKTEKLGEDLDEAKEVVRSEISEKLDIAKDLLTEKKDEVSTNTIELVNDIGDLKEEVVQELDAKKHDVVERLKEEVNNKQQDLVDALKEVDAKKDEIAESVTKVIDDTKQKIVEDLKEVDAKKDEIAESVTKEVDDKKQKIVEGLKNVEARKDEIVESVTKEVDDKKQKVDEDLKEIEFRKDTIVESVTKEVDDKEQKIVEGLKEVEAKKDDVLESVTKELDDKKQKIVEELKEVEARKDEILESVTKEVDDKKQKIVDGLKEVEVKKDDICESVTKEVDDKKQKIVEGLKEVGAKKDDVLEKVTKEVDGEKQKIIEGLTEVKDEIVESVIKEVDDKKQKIVEGLKETEPKKDEIIKSVTKEVDDKKQKIDEDIKEIESRKNEIVESVAKEVDDKKQKIVEGLKEAEARKDEIVETVTKEVDDKKQEIVEGLKETEAKKDEIVESVTKEVDDKKQKIDEDLKEIESRKNEIVESVAKEVDDKKQKVVEGLKEAEARKDLIVESLAKEVDDKKQKIVENLKEVEAKKDDLFESVTKEVGDKKQKIVEDLKEVDAKKNEIIESVAKEVDDKKQDILETAKKAEESVGETVGDIQTETEVTIDQIKEKIEEADEIIKKEKEAIESKAESLIHDLEGVTKEVSEKKYDVIESIEKVGEMVVDVAIGQEVKPESPESTLDKIEDGVEKGVEEVKEFVEDIKDAVLSIFRKDSIKKEEEELEKRVEVLAKDYEIVSDMSKSVIFEKCDIISDEVREKEEQFLEKSALDVEDNYNALTDITKSVIFDKCESGSGDKDKQTGAFDINSTEIEEKLKTDDKKAEMPPEQEQGKLTNKKLDEKQIESDSKHLESGEETKTLGEKQIESEVIKIEIDGSLSKPTDAKETLDFNQEEDASKKTVDGQHGQTETTKVDSSPIKQADVKQPVISSDKAEDSRKSVEMSTSDLIKSNKLDSEQRLEPEISVNDKESVVSKIEADIEQLLEKSADGIAEVLSETKDTITSIWKEPDIVEEENVLEKSAHDIESNYEKLTEMSKSILFEKCGDPSADELLEEKASADKYEKLLEDTAHGVEEEFQKVTDMSKSIIFDKCESPTSIKAKKFLEETGQNIEDEFEKVTDMTQSIIFEKCDKPMEVEKDVRRDSITVSQAQKPAIEEKSALLNGRLPELEKASSHDESAGESRKSSQVVVDEKPTEDSKKDGIIVADCKTDIEKSPKTLDPDKDSRKDSLIAPTDNREEDKGSRKGTLIVHDDISHAEKDESLKSVKERKDSLIDSTDRREKSPNKESRKSSLITQDVQGYESLESDKGRKDSLIPLSDRREKSPEADNGSRKSSLTAEDEVSRVQKHESPESSKERKDSLITSTDHREKSPDKGSRKSSLAPQDEVSHVQKHQSPESGTGRKDSLIVSTDHREKSPEADKGSRKSSLIAQDEVSQVQKQELAESDKGRKDSLIIHDEINSKQSPQGSRRDSEVHHDIQSEKFSKAEQSSRKCSVTAQDVKSDKSPDVAKKDNVIAETDPPEQLSKADNGSRKSSLIISTDDVEESPEAGKKQREGSLLAQVDQREKSPEVDMELRNASVIGQHEKPNLEVESSLELGRESRKGSVLIDDKKPDVHCDKSLESDIEARESIVISQDNKLVVAQGNEEKSSTSGTETITDLESKKCDKKETIPITQIEKLAVSAVNEKKLSISDVEISLTDEKANKTDNLVSGIADSKSDVVDEKQALVSTLEEIPKDLSGKSTPDQTKIEKIDEHISETSHPTPVVPPSNTVSSTVEKPISSSQEENIAQILKKSGPEVPLISTIKEVELTRTTQPPEQMAKTPQLFDSERIESEDDDDDDIPGSPMSMTSQAVHSRDSSRYDFDEDRNIPAKTDPMSTSFYGTLPTDEMKLESDLEFERALAEHEQTRGQQLVAEASSSYLYEITQAKYAATGCTSVDCDNANVSSQDIKSKTESPTNGNHLMATSFIGTELPTAQSEIPTTTAESVIQKDPLQSWGKPLGLPSPAPPNENNKGTPKKERKLAANVTAKNKLNDDKKRAESPSKYKNKKYTPVYVDLTYVPHHGNSYYSYVDYFKRIRARYYVFSGIEPSKEVYNALLEAKQCWEDKDLEVTIIPTYDTDILGYWVAENEELLTKYKIDLSPSASRCTINLQDHETSCSAYRLEF